MQHPDQVVESRELVLLRAIYTEAKFKPLAKHGIAARHFKVEYPDDAVSFMFNLLNPRESGLSIEEQRVLLLKMNDDKTIDLYWDQGGVLQRWDTLTQFYITVQLSVLDNRYADLSAKYPTRDGSIGHKALDLDAERTNIADDAQKIDWNAPYEFGPLRQDSNKRVRCNDIPLPLPDHLRILLVYLMAKPGYHSDKDIFRHLKPLRTFQADSVKTMQKYISAIRIILYKFTKEVRIEREVYPESSGYKLVYKKPRKERNK
jgi:hypothetical protein